MGQSMMAKRCQAERPRLCPVFSRGVGNGVEPGQQDARGKGAIEDDMRQQDAAEPEDRDFERPAEERQCRLVDPARTAPDRQQAEGHDQCLE